MNLIEMVKLYRSCGFVPFPLQANSKFPLKGVPLEEADKHTYPKGSNVGLFTGSPNGFVVLDADAEETKQKALSMFYDAGILSFLTVVRTPKRGGLHFWLKLIEIPKDTQSFYKLDASVGAGELRVNRPSYVVAPGSKIPEGEYTFTQGGAEYLSKEQPYMEWKDICWCIPQVKHVPVQKSSADPVRRRYNPHPGVLTLLHYLNKEYIPFVSYSTGSVDNTRTYKSKSEAEYALVLGLILAGWSFEQIEDVFIKNRPPHYVIQRNPENYLTTTYNNALKNITIRRA